MFADRFSSSSSSGKVSVRIVVVTNHTDTRGKKESGGCSRGPWRILNIHPGDCPKFLDEFTRAYIRASRDGNRERDRANPPAIHCDFRQLARSHCHLGRNFLSALRSRRKRSKPRVTQPSPFSTSRFSRGIVLYKSGSLARLPRSARSLIDPGSARFDKSVRYLALCKSHRGARR